MNELNGMKLIGKWQDTLYRGSAEGKYADSILHDTNQQINKCKCLSFFLSEQKRLKIADCVWFELHVTNHM